MCYMYLSMPSDIKPPRTKDGPESSQPAQQSFWLNEVKTYTGKSVQVLAQKISEKKSTLYLNQESNTGCWIYNYSLAVSEPTSRESLCLNLDFIC